MYTGNKKGPGISPDGYLQPEERTIAILEKPCPTWGTSCSVIQNPGRKSFCPAESGHSGRSSIARLQVLWIPEQLVKLPKERTDSTRHHFLGRQYHKQDNNS